jgi:archaellum component FlaC
MKRHSVTCISLFFCLFLGVTNVPTTGAASDLTGLDSTIRLLQEQLGRQIDRIKAAREKVDSQMGLTRIRLAEQLNKSGDDLAVQIEALGRLREKLTETTSESDTKINIWKEESAQLLSRSLSDISAQINQTNELMQRLEQIKNQVSGDCKSSSGTGDGPARVTPTPVEGTEVLTGTPLSDTGPTAFLPPSEMPPTPSPG